MGFRVFLICLYSHSVLSYQLTDHKTMSHGSCNPMTDFLISILETTTIFCFLNSDKLLHICYWCIVFS